MAASQWNDNAPIYRQLKERIMAMMLDGVLRPGDRRPSVRQIAAEYQLNPLTVSRAYQEFFEDGLIEKHRGIGMFMAHDAAEKLTGTRARAVPERTMARGLRAYPASGVKCKPVVGRNASGAERMMAMCLWREEI